MLAENMLVMADTNPHSEICPRCTMSPRHGCEHPSRQTTPTSPNAMHLHTSLRDPMRSQSGVELGNSVRRGIIGRDVGDGRNS